MKRRKKQEVKKTVEKSGISSSQKISTIDNNFDLRKVEHYKEDFDDWLHEIVFGNL